MKGKESANRTFGVDTFVHASLDVLVAANGAKPGKNAPLNDQWNRLRKSPRIHIVTWVGCSSMPHCFGGDSHIAFAYLNYANAARLIFMFNDRFLPDRSA